MPLKYLHTCIKCGESFDNEVNTPKDTAVCPHCQMLPEAGDLPPVYHDGLTGVSPYGTRMLRTKDDPVVEIIDSGMTGQRVKGEANHAACKPHRHHIFKKKACIACKKIYQPDAGNSKWCPACKPLTVVATRQAKKYLEIKDQAQAKAKGRPVITPDKIALDKLASGLITESSTGINHMRPTTATELEAGYWIELESGQNHENRKYVSSRNLISGQVCLDLWKPRQRFLS